MSLVHDSLRAFAAGAAVCCIVYAATAVPAETRASIDEFAFKPDTQLNNDDRPLLERQRT